MGKTAILKLQNAIITALEGSTQLMGKITGIYDYVPKNVTFPYITIDEATESKFNTFNRFGRELNIVIHIISQYKGFKEQIEILDIINSLLDYEQITLNDFELVYIRFDEAIKIIEPDGLTRDLACTFSAIVQES